MIISFGHTSPQLLAGKKTVTRRRWNLSHAEKISARVDHDAWNKLPFAGGRKIARIRLTAPVYQEPITAITADEVTAEGFPELTVDDFLEMWTHKLRGSLDDEVSVVRFRVQSVFVFGRLDISRAESLTDGVIEIKGTDRLPTVGDPAFDVWWHAWMPALRLAKSVHCKAALLAIMSVGGHPFYIMEKI